MAGDPLSIIGDGLRVGLTMAFTDEDLKRLKDDLADESTLTIDLDIEEGMALIARLEAAEACIEEAKGMGLICCKEVCCKGTAYPRWLAACGKDRDG